MPSIFSFFKRLFSRKAGNQIMTPEAFTSVFHKAMVKAFPAVHFALNEDLSITSSNPETQDVIATHYPDNAYNNYRADPANLQHVIQKYVDAAGDFFGPKKTDLNAIVAVLKPLSFVKAHSEWGKNATGEATVMLTAPYNEHLVITYAEDQPKSFRYMLAKELEELDLPLEDLHELATIQLTSILNEKGAFNQADGVYSISVEGDYEASLLLIDALWTKDIFPVEGNFVVAVPNRDILMVTGSENEEGVAKLRAFAAESFSQNSYGISPYLYQWNGEKFIPFD